MDGKLQLETGVTQRCGHATVYKRQGTMITKSPIAANPLNANESMLNSMSCRKAA
jgi:hypothetical protein